jgi:hypothetical protein
MRDNTIKYWHDSVQMPSEEDNICLHTRSYARTHTHTHGRVTNPPRQMSDAWATFVVPHMRGTCS